MATIQLYVPSAAEKLQLENLTQAYKDAYVNAALWAQRADALNTFMTSAQMSNAGLNERTNLFNGFKGANDWFGWQSWFSPIPTLNGNINRTPYINHALNVRDAYNDAVEKTKFDLAAFQAVLDKKNDAIIEASGKAIESENATETAKTKLEQTKLITDNLPFIIIGVVILIVISFYAYRKFKK